MDKGEEATRLKNEMKRMDNQQYIQKNGSWESGQCIMERMMMMEEGQCREREEGRREWREKVGSGRGEYEQ